MKKNLDLSDLKENDLESTASFVDLMSRSERKNHEKNKIKQQQELRDILFKEDTKKVRNQKKDQKRQEQLNAIAKSGVKYEKVNNKSKDLKLENVKESVFNHVDNNINEEKSKYGVFNIIVGGLLIIASLAFYIYSILFTNIQSDQTNLLIGGLIILGMICIFCISIVCGKILYKVLSVINYLIFIGYVIFNLLVVIGL